MGSRQSFETPHSRVPSAMIGQYILNPDTHSNRDTGTTSVVGAKSLINSIQTLVLSYRGGSKT